MTLTATALLSATFLLLLPWVSIQAADSSIDLTVFNSISNTANQTFRTTIAFRGNLLGAMRRLKKANENFRFNVTENEDYGPFLESVNGVSGNPSDQTYWEILVKSSGKLIKPDVGVGCFIPKPNDHVILKFTKW